MPNINFTYDREKDIWCLLNYGKTSNNSKKPTRVYDAFIAAYGEESTVEKASAFIDSYLLEKQIDIPKFSEACERDWNGIAEKYRAIAERVFGVTLAQTITAYLTVNTRCPYSIEERHFFVSVFSAAPRNTIMHELWHFYTWQKFGAEAQPRLGKQKYNDIKEALTALLNIECADLLPEGTTDKGYPQHQEMRAAVIQVWQETKDIEKVWKACEQMAG